MPSPLRILAALILFVSVAACGARSSVPESLAGLSAAPLVPGVGLGELKLNALTMQDFLRRHGSGRPATLVGDDLEFEFMFGGEQLVVSFFAPEDCRLALKNQVRESANMLRDAPGFLSAYPACGQSLLNRIVVASQPDSHESFYTGAADQRIALDKTLNQLVAPDKEDAATPDDSRLSGVLSTGMDEVILTDGFKVHIGNSPSGPNKGRLVVRKMTVYSSPLPSAAQ